MNTLRGITAGLAISINTVLLCMPLFLVGLVRMLTAGGIRARLARWMDETVQLWVGGNRAIFRLLSVSRIHTTLDCQAQLSRRRWYLVISNHQSWADILVLQNALRGHIPMLKFFTKRELIWVPFVGIAMWLLGFPYVRRLSRQQIEADPALADLDRKATLDACRRFRDHPSAVLSFLEGSRFTAAKHRAQGGRFHHLLDPKIGGVSYVVDSLRDRIHKVLDITIVYGDRVPSFWELLQGRCRNVEVHVQCRDLPESVRSAHDAAEVRECLRPWIDELWRRKDERLTGLDGLAN